VACGHHVQTEAAVHSAGNTSILVVDNEHEHLRVLRDHLASRGFQVHTAENGKDALKSILNEGSRIVISDWTMPGLSGVELCRTIRRHEGVAFAYVILIGEPGASEDRIEEAFAAGADEFLAKPINLRELDARLEAALRMCRLYREIEQRTREACSANARLSVANAQLETANEKLRYVAVTDALTGLPNRRHILMRLDEAWQVSTRHKTPLACAVIDVDHFKSVNDTHGHMVGDVVLREVAQSMLLAVRGGEVLGRFGGEEFLLLLPNSGVESAAVAAERLRQTIEEMRVPVPGTKLGVTISLGVAERLPTMSSSEDLLGMADDALYAAKRAGRNSVRRRPVPEEAKPAV